MHLKTLTADDRDGQVRFIAPCAICGAIRREFYRATDASTRKYPVYDWVPDDHDGIDLAQCIMFLVRRLDEVEERVSCDAL